MKDQNNTGIAMEAFRKPNGIMRSLNLAVLAFFVTTFYAPAALAIKTSVEEQKKQAKLEATLPENQSDTALYASKLKKMKGHFKEAERLYIDQKNSVIGQVTDIDAAIENGGSIFKQDDRWKTELEIGLALASDAVALNKKVDKDFSQVKDWIKEKELPPVFLERHNEAYGQYQTRYDEFIVNLKPLKKAKDDDQKVAALKKLNKFLVDQQFGRKHQEFDGETMGNSAPMSAEGKPLLLSKADYFRAGIDSNPKLQVAALGDFDFTQLPGADDPAFLAESDEVVLSQAVLDKAAELEHDPVKIYHWVRNNIETIPGWGSYQNSDLTLGAQRGNSFDVASLLIALLRASEIPSRYVMGVAEIDAERYTNWFGNFDNADVATDYAVANGIAVQVITSGGEITKVRTQHMWVQAAIDYFPSRGAKNRSADSWVDLDASFKQYVYTEGVDVSDIADIDPEVLLSDFVNSGLVNESRGSVRSFRSTGLLEAQRNVEASIQEYVMQNSDGSTVQDFTGGRKAILQSHISLPSGLPYVKFSEGSTYAFVPEILQNKVGIGFGNQRQVFPFSKVNNENITLRFVPETADDELALSSLIPDGETVDVDQFATTIPGYLARVTPELSLNGDIFMRGNALRLGDEVDISYQISGPLTVYAPYNYSVVAGSYLNIPLIAQSVSLEKLNQLREKTISTADILEGSDQEKLDLGINNNLFKDLFQSIGLGYFSQLEGIRHLSSLQGEVEQKLEFGYGSFGYEVGQTTFFGIPRGIEMGGVSFNILIASSAESYSGDSERRVQARLQLGLASSMLEHSTPELVFQDDQTMEESVSAIEAIRLAVESGQDVYQITRDNLSSALASLSIDQSIKDEIRSYVGSSDRVAVAHASNVTVPGWSGAGYLLLDLNTGAGSYKISGGGNGSDLSIDDFALFLTSAALAEVDSQVGQVSKNAGRLLFADRLFNYFEKVKGASSAVGLWAVLISSLPAVFSDAPVEDKVGAVSANIFGFYATNYVIGALIGSSFGILATVLLSVFFAIFMAILISALISVQFSLNFNNRRDVEYA